MRVAAHCAAIAVAAAVSINWYHGTLTAAQAPGKGDAAGVPAAARQALGGDKKLAAVKTIDIGMGISF